MSNPIVDNQEFRRGNWKKALRYILDEGGISLEDGSSKEGHTRLIRGLEVGAPQDTKPRSLRFFESYNSAEKTRFIKEIEHAGVYIYTDTIDMLEELKELGLIEVKEVGGGSKIALISLNSKGVEIALKLQEHDDNASRFEQQRDISATLKDNSSKSVRTARVALIVSSLLLALGGYRVYQLEQKIESHKEMEVRINSLGAEVTRLNTSNAGVAILKGRIDALEKEKKERLDVAKISKQPLPTSKKSP